MSSRNSINIITERHYPMLGGVELAVDSVARELNRMGNIDIALTCSSMPEIPRDFEYLYQCYRPYSYPFLTNPLKRLAQRKMIHETKPALFHGMVLHGAGYTAMQLGKKYKLPFIAQSHGSDIQVVPEINYGARLNQRLKSKIKQVVDSADCIIAVSNMNKSNLIDFGADPHKVEVVYNGVDYDYIQNTPFIDSRLEYGLCPDDFVIISVGRNSPIKRLDLLFTAIRFLRGIKGIKCICVGPPNGIMKLAEKHGVADIILPIGRIPESFRQGEATPHKDLINLMRCANLYVSTSYIESFGNAALESLACGTPIIVGKNHGVRDLIEEKLNGNVLANDTATELSDLIRNIYDNRDEYSRRRGRISESVSAYTWKNSAERLVGVYENVLRK